MMGQKKEPSTSATAARLFWATIAVVWFLLVGTYAGALVFQLPTVSPATGVALVLIGVASSAVWLNGIRHLAMWATASFWGSRSHRPQQSKNTPDARVVLLYCTADDFNPDALRSSMAQQHPVSTVILDDSTTMPAQRAVDSFARNTGARVVRRPHRTGFKAGNLNHGIAGLIDDFDYFVILDSDEVIPPHFVSQALGWFCVEPQVGIVQARHRAWRGVTTFTAAFSGMVGSHVAVAQPARSQAGFSAFLGRGAMISADCYRAAGPIPEVVLEDVAFSLEVRLAGYRIAYDHDLVCVEDYPVDYRAFRSQHTKLVEGATEFLVRSARRILTSRLSVREKADLLIEQLMVPLMGMAGLALIVSGLLLTLPGPTAHPLLWAVAVTALLGMAPLLPEAVRVLRQHGFLAAATFLALATTLYSSTLLITLRATAKILLGHTATFTVTPKKPRRGRMLAALRLDLWVTSAAVSAALLLSGSAVPALPIAGPTLASLCFAVFGARLVRPAALHPPVRDTMARLNRGTLSQTGR
jgi:hypothetical protein